MQDEIVSRLARTLGVQLIVAEARRAGRSLHPDATELTTSRVTITQTTRHPHAERASRRPRDQWRRVVDNAYELRVQLSDGTILPARLLGKGKQLNIAL
jgi:hypothetical protein